MKPLSRFGLVFAACALLWNGCDPKESVHNFPHKPHIAAELACEFCHEFGDQTVSMPKLDVCASCHELTDDKVFNRCLECHKKHSVEWKPENFVSHQKMFRPLLAKGWGDVRYNHAEYLGKDADCLACHAAVKNAERSAIENLPSMKTAIAAQEKLGKPADCAVCHSQLTPSTPPPSHANRWKETHGRMTEFTGKDNCLMCHNEETCFTCHKTEKPKSHTNQFRRRTHGIKAEFDRAKCLVCHRSDECASCHQAAANPIPATIFHTPDASCLNCHSPLAAQGPQPRPAQQFFKPMPHRMMMGATAQKCLTCHQF